MRRKQVFLIVMSLSYFLSAQTDVTPPTVTSFSFSPTSINVTSGPDITDITLVASDVGDGLNYADVGIISPSGRDTATTTIHFTLAEAGNVTVDIFNVAGQKIDTVVNESMAKGSHSVSWDASNFSAGIYFYSVKANGNAKTMKMTLLK